ncbi:MAG: hypothetical protein BIFFINMI_01879 [Phycisphaerae bacterium]|nr:hypothetical protein [Phycisphaerae bacterium]
MNIDGLDQLDFERVGVIRRAFKAGVVHPLINWILPASFMRWFFRITRSEMAAASWANPGGWKSMELSYRETKHPQIADRLLARVGSVPVALRNRKRLVVEIFTRMIADRDGQATHIVALGAGPGMNTLEAMERSGHRDVHAWMIDLNPDSFEFGRQLAASKGLSDRVRYIHGDVQHYRRLVDAVPNIVEMIGICEYLPDEAVRDLARAVSDVMPPGSRLVANSLSKRHGTDRFFRRVMDLHMIHRSPEHVSGMLADAGIVTEHVVPEPMGVYRILICRKQ